MTVSCAWCEADPPAGELPDFCSRGHRDAYFAACTHLGDELYRTRTVSMLNLHNRYRELLAKAGDDRAPLAGLAPSLVDRIAADDTPRWIKVTVFLIIFGAAYVAGLRHFGML